MNQTPKKKKADTHVNTEAAIKAANALTKATQREPTADEGGPMKAIFIRIEEETYNNLQSLFRKHGTSMAAAGRAAILHLADHIMAGELSIRNGVITRGDI
jgi:hypothetical protein